jgi:hypothetical protein
MGHWGVKSYENDDAADALDTAYERVHGEKYDELMDDRNPLSFDEVQKTLANAQTLATAIEELGDAVGRDVPSQEWDEIARLAFAGVVVRHAEFGVPVRAEWLDQAIESLEHETIGWDEATARRLRRDKEVALLRSLKARSQ